MPRRPLTVALAFARRAMLSLALAGLLVPGAPGPVAPAGADHDPRHDSVARVLVVIDKVTVLDDNDPESEGDIQIAGWFHKVEPGCPADTSDYACLTQLIQFELKEFGADSGETVTLNRIIPSARDNVIDESITPEFGIPIYPGQAYRLVFVGFDEDLVFDDFLGRIDLIMTEQNGWGIGTHTDRARLYRSAGGSGPPGTSPSSTRSAASRCRTSSRWPSRSPRGRAAPRTRSASGCSTAGRWTRPPSRWRSTSTAPARRSGRGK